MLENLVNHFNETTTQNGAVAYKSTKSDVLDLFSQGGAMRGRSDADVKSLVSLSYLENPLLTLKTLFYLRDIKQGQGERRFFRLGMREIADKYPVSVRMNIHLVPQFGRWDDLLILLDTKVHEDVINLFAEQLKLDVDSETPSLLAKWLPSENASSLQTKTYAKKVRKGLKLSPREYRKTLSAIRKKIGIIETKITEGRYADIQYDKIPSKAGMLYRGAFKRHDENRYSEFLESLSKGEVTVNAGTLLPNDIVGKIVGDGWRWSQVSEEEEILFEGQWNNLENFIGDKVENSLVMADVSESMSGQPMNVSIGLALYIAERNKGAYKDHFLTFTDEPSIVKIKGNTIVEKVRNVKSRKGYSTNIQLALETILEVAIKDGLSNDELVKKLYIISDMQFDDYSIRGTSVNIFNSMRKRFENHGYDFPEIVFWNVNAFGNQPATMNEQGVQLVSGYSPSIMKHLLSSNGKTAYEFMLEVLQSERYVEVLA